MAGIEVEEDDMILESWFLNRAYHPRIGVSILSLGFRDSRELTVLVEYRSRGKCAVAVQWKVQKAPGAIESFVDVICVVVVRNERSDSKRWKMQLRRNGSCCRCIDGVRGRADPG